MRMAFKVPSEVPLATLTAYQTFENNVRIALGNSKTDEELRQNIQSAISTLEETFCPQPEEKN
jgi:hypothetical protein